MLQGALLSYLPEINSLVCILEESISLCVSKKKNSVSLTPRGSEPTSPTPSFFQEVPGQKELSVPTVHSSLGVLWHLEGLPTLYHFWLLCDYCSHYLQGHVYSARCMKTSHTHVHEPLMSQLATPLKGTCPALGHHFPCHLPQLGLLNGLKKPHPVAKYRKSATGERRPALSRGGVISSLKPTLPG